MPASPAIKPQYDYISPFKKAREISYVIENNKEKYSYQELISSTPVDEFIEEIPFHLFEIRERIQNSKHILNYQFNWDDDGALPVNPLIFDRVTRFLETYADRIYHLYNVMLITPEIVPVNDGSIDLEWTLENSSFLINFKNTNEEIAFYYGEFKDDDNVIFDTNGQINTSTVKDKFASYLSDLS